MIEVVRGGIVESRHHVHVAVADARGKVEDGVVERLGITEEELALCCGSHEGQEEHVAGTRSILTKAGLDESALRCGPHLPFSEASARALIRGGGEPRPVHNNCSGNHAGMLALAVAMGWDPEGYHLADHPVQRRMLAEISRWSQIPGERIGTAVDGCGVTCFSVPLVAMAASFARFAAASGRGEGPARIIQAMVRHPHRVGGTGRACTEVMQRTGPRAFVKLGAEGGVYGGGLPGREWGFAIKVSDGSRRAAEVVLVAVLEALGALDPVDVDALPRWKRPAVRNTRGEVVGELRSALTLAWS